MTKRSTTRNKAALGRPRDLETTASILRAALDADVVLDALYGPLYHRLLVPYEEALPQKRVNDAPFSDAPIDALVDTVFGGLARQPGRGPSDGHA
jgi:hypothetical protein